VAGTGTGGLGQQQPPPPVAPAALALLFIGSTRPALRTVPGNDCCSLGIGGSCAPNLRGSSVSCPIALIWLAGKRVLITREPPTAVKGRTLGKQEASLETGTFNASCIVPLCGQDAGKWTGEAPTLTDPSPTLCLKHICSLSSVFCSRHHTDVTKMAGVSVKPSAGAAGLLARSVAERQLCLTGCAWSARQRHACERAERRGESVLCHAAASTTERCTRVARCRRLPHAR